MKKIALLLVCFIAIKTKAQVNIGANTAPNANAMVEISGSTKGLLLPRIALTSTSSFAPLSAHVAGMTVYNTATAGTAPNNVVPGYYYNDGTQWLRLLSQSSSGPTEWYLTGTATDAVGDKTSDIFRNGSIGIGTSPASKIDVAAGTTTVNTVINATGSINDYLQFNVQNTSTSSKAQSGYAATADNGSATTGFAWMGINNSNFNYPTTYNIGSDNDVSFLGSGQDLYVANAHNSKSIIFSTGKAASPYFNERMRITNGGLVGIGTNAPSSNLHVVNSGTGTNSIAQFLTPSLATTQATYLKLGRALSNGDEADIVFNWTSANSTSNYLGFGFFGSSLYMVVTNGGRIGIGTTTPANKLEVTHGTAGNSGLRFTNLTSAPMLATNASGDVISAPLNTANGVFWGLTGNAATTPTTNFIGTTDAQDFATKTNNVERMRVASGGYVGIGTTTPLAVLDVAASTTTNNTVVNGAGSINDFLQFNIQNTSTGTHAQSGYAATADNGTSTTGFAWIGINNSTFNYPTAYNIGGANDVSYVGSGQDMYIANASNTKSIIFSTGKAASPYFDERMRVTNSGNVGIGTATPINKLTIYHTSNTDGLIIQNTTGGIGSTSNLYMATYADAVAGTLHAGSKISAIDDGAFSAHLTFSTKIPGVEANALNERMRLTSGGNVGIGTTSPNAPLQFANTLVNRKIVLWEDANNDHQIYGLGINANMLRYQVSGTGNNHVFYAGTSTTTSNELMRIQGNGFVGVGTTSPNAKLDVTGIKSTGSGAGTGANNDGPSQVIITAGFNGTSRYNDWPSGWGGGLSIYDICGAGTFFNSYITRSDIKLKTDINNMSDLITTNLLKLRPVTYLMKEQIKESEGLQYGFIAQEVKVLFPSIVTESSDPNGIIGMNYQALIAPAIYVIQQQQIKIEKLQSEMEIVKTQNDNLQKIMSEIEILKTQLKSLQTNPK